MVSVQAARLADGRIAFDQPPNLVEATTLDQASVGSDRYHFAIEVPANAGETLGAVAITPLDRVNRITFNVGASEAELAPVYARGSIVPMDGQRGRSCRRLRQLTDSL